MNLYFGISLQQIIISAFMGAFVSTIFWLLIEWSRKPRIKMWVEKPHEILLNDPLGRPEGRWLTVVIYNKKPMPVLGWFLHRYPAYGCKAYIIIKNKVGIPVFDDEIIARWSDSPEPFTPILTIEEDKSFKSIEKIYDPQKLIKTYELPPGEKTEIHVVYRAKDDKDAYVWNNESYLYNGWKKPEWKLGEREYRVSVRVTTMGKKIEKTFYLLNHENFESFRLNSKKKLLR